jgi:uncharacterized repeat protein (TIGR01451 family)
MGRPGRSRRLRRGQLRHLRFRQRRCGSLWQSATTGTNATFQGKPQHTYGFKSVARDNAGNVEAQHASADASTLIVANPQFQLTVSPATTNLGNPTTFSYNVSVKNVGTLNLSNVIMRNAMPAGISLDYISYGRGSMTIVVPAISGPWAT